MTDKQGEAIKELRFSGIQLWRDCETAENEY